jgi:hypothetical protein
MYVRNEAFAYWNAPFFLEPSTAFSSGTRAARQSAFSGFNALRPNLATGLPFGMSSDETYDSFPARQSIWKKHFSRRGESMFRILGPTDRRGFHRNTAGDRDGLPKN